MKEIIFATFDSNLSFNKNEKVIAYNWFEKLPPFRFGTYIKKFDETEVLLEDEMCRKTETIQMKIYNIGTYKIKSTMGCFAQIVEYDLSDARREKLNENKRIGWKAYWS